VGGKQRGEDGAKDEEGEERDSDGDHGLVAEGPRGGA
jgi:hypothetical protein